MWISIQHISSLQFTYHVPVLHLESFLNSSACLSFKLNSWAVVRTVACQLRAARAQAILYGEGFDVLSRFGIQDENEKGQILLKKIFEIYQDLAELGTGIH